MLRDDIKTATISAMKSGDKETTATLRLISAKIKDKDIEIRTQSVDFSDDDLVTDVLQKMAKQRKESIQLYQQGGRNELAKKEQIELNIISSFLPQMLDEETTLNAIKEVILTTKASSIKDMGSVMKELKSLHGAKLEMGLVSKLVKSLLN
jgi:uncharacterized protein YqeY